jgi:hypothetical protein
MAVAEKAREVLKLDQLQLPSRPRVVELHVDDYTDWTGDDALRVQVILDESTTDEDLKAPNTFAITDAIRDGLRKHDVNLFPYIFFAKQSELDALRYEEDTEEE